ncbi:MAG TPA: hypothetical protein VFU05_17555 [Cyclobacteriaceae bacterium]|nr:hypothetical protein [Cyclobacteriaceae bacterium]
MVNENELAKLKKISDSLTETELKPAREIFAAMSAKYPDGIIPKSNDPTGLLREFQLPRAVVELMLFLREEYPEEDVALAICVKLLGELANDY